MRLGLSIVSPPSFEVNRHFYQKVGQNWQWVDKLKWNEDSWNEYVSKNVLETWIGQIRGEPIGYFELGNESENGIEITYFGLLPKFIGQGLGGALLTAAVERAWKIPGISRVWVHTCSKDHKYALDNYIKRGFKLFKTEGL